MVFQVCVNSKKDPSKGTFRVAQVSFPQGGGLEVAHLGSGLVESGGGVVPDPGDLAPETRGCRTERSHRPAWPHGVAPASVKETQENASSI